MTMVAVISNCHFGIIYGLHNHQNDLLCFHELNKTWRILEGAIQLFNAFILTLIEKVDNFLCCTEVSYKAHKMLFKD